MEFDRQIVIKAEKLNIGYEKKVVLHDLDFEVYKGEIFFIMGDSGCGKSTLLKHLTGLYCPLSGDIRLYGQSIVNADNAQRKALMRKFGVTYQGGALFGSMTLGENVAFPLREFTELSEEEMQKTVSEKLQLVGLAGFENYYPAEISGGMKKRAGLARALALDPELLFFDEPSAGLDPISSAALDRLILELRDKLGTTVVIVSHELDSIFSIADRAILLSKASGTIAAEGKVEELLHHSPDLWVRKFLSRDGQLRQKEN
jgi:phospholipid/cholesterol/gamma-HCH transport system ATP-binding protein